jgi:hypothetical protein
MTAEPADKPEQRAAGVVVVFDAGQSPTVRARRQGRWMQPQMLGSLVRRFRLVGLLSAGSGATIMSFDASSRTNSNRQTWQR